MVAEDDNLQIYQDYEKSCTIVHIAQYHEK